MAVLPDGTIQGARRAQVLPASTRPHDEGGGSRAFGLSLSFGLRPRRDRPRSSPIFTTGCPVVQPRPAPAPARGPQPSGLDVDIRRQTGLRPAFRPVLALFCARFTASVGVVTGQLMSRRRGPASAAFIMRPGTPRHRLHRQGISEHRAGPTSSPASEPPRQHLCLRAVRVRSHARPHTWAQDTREHEVRLQQTIPA